MTKQEFVVAGAYRYNHSSPLRWLLSHIWHHRVFALGFVGFGIFFNILFSLAPILVGQAYDVIRAPERFNELAAISLQLLIIYLVSGTADLAHSLSLEVLAQKVEASAREELYRSLLGKSQTFHNRQRVGDMMALATDDVQQLNVSLNPGVLFIFNTVLGIVVPMILMAALRIELLLVPVIFVITYIIAVRLYSKEMNPVAHRQRGQFGKMNAVLEETISGIEVVKASAQESFERHKFRRNARLFRGFFVRQGWLEARYLPLLLFGIALGASFLHAVIMHLNGQITEGDVVTYVGLFSLLRFPTFISVFSFSLVQLGLASAERLFKVIVAESELDENSGGYSQPMVGEIVFDNVTFAFDDDPTPLLAEVSFTIKPGETVAIVGTTGSGKSTLTQLINRTYDVTSGRVLVDGVDVREWDMNSLRSQISKIEQDVFLFSRSVAENIAFGAPEATQEQIEFAAREAQAHDFIQGFSEGYETKVGERGVTLSGGQRQRIALARAFLSDPRILILDDSTSAIDSATEDEIQKAIQRAQEGRTTLLITHRLSQIRWADHILVIEKGRLAAEGTHEALLRRSQAYRRIFARYEIELPPLETSEPLALSAQEQ